MSNSIIGRFLRCLAAYFDGSKQRFGFIKVTSEGITVEGKIKMVRMEFQQAVTFTAGNFVDRRGNPANIEEGSATWTGTFADRDGNPVDVSVVANPDNELEATVTSGTTEATGVVTFRADGDPDAGEDAPIVLTSDVIIDAGNVVAGSLTNTEPQDV